MPQQECGIVNLTDLDNSLLQSFSSLAVGQIGRRVAQLPIATEGNIAYRFINHVENSFYSLQQARKGSKEYLSQMTEVAQAHQRPIEHIVFSARSHHHRETTINRLHELGLGRFISDVFLNGIINNNNAMDQFIRNKLEAGNTVIVLQDDTSLALQIAEKNPWMAENNPRVLVYLLSNLTNRKLRRSKECPKNVLIVDDLGKIPIDFDSRLKEGSI